MTKTELVCVCNGKSDPLRNIFCLGSFYFFDIIKLLCTPYISSNVRTKHYTPASPLIWSEELLSTIQPNWAQNILVVVGQ